MKCRRIIFITLLLAALVWGFWLFLAQTPLGKLLIIYNTPIKFYGKVIDQHDNPVPYAEIKYNVADKFLAPGSKYESSTDKHGYFSIKRVRGAGIYIEVSKHGYYRTPATDGKIGSYASIRYAEAMRDNKDLPIPTKDSPTVFTLRKMGETESLIYIERSSVRIPKDGTPVMINLRTGKATKSGSGELKVECWTEDQNKDEKRQYPWHCRVSVPGGGLVKREGEFNFEAPVEGYQPFDEIKPPEERWASNAERQYFVKTADNRYARIEIRIRTGGDHFVVIQSYLNPQPGSRNLEYDPAKRINR